MLEMVSFLQTKEALEDHFVMGQRASPSACLFRLFECHVKNARVFKVKRDRLKIRC